MGVFISVEGMVYAKNKKEAKERAKTKAQEREPKIDVGPLAGKVYVEPMNDLQAAVRKQEQNKRIEWRYIAVEESL